MRPKTDSKEKVSINAERNSFDFKRFYGVIEKTSTYIQQNHVRKMSQISGGETTVRAMSIID